VNRDHLAALAAKPNLTQALRAYFQTEEGQQTLKDAPGIQSEIGKRPMTEDEAIVALVEESTSLKENP